MSAGIQQKDRGFDSMGWVGIRGTDYDIQTSRDAKNVQGVVVGGEGEKCEAKEAGRKRGSKCGRGRGGAVGEWEQEG
eukprot:684306-Hanusia_phi.AAC.3